MFNKLTSTPISDQPSTALSLYHLYEEINQIMRESVGLWMSEGF
jgi:hypothetical protein